MGFFTNKSIFLTKSRFFTNKSTFFDEKLIFLLKKLENIPNTAKEQGTLPFDFKAKNINEQIKNIKNELRTNQKEIDQSNVVWRRAINTANTAAVNAANQTNAQNLLNISNWALSSAWQQWRDEASWVNTSSQNAANRNHNLAMAALERSTVLDLQDKASKDSLYELIGRFGFEVFNASKNP